MIDHAATGGEDSPKERALRLEAESADLEVQALKRQLAHAKGTGTSVEYKAWRYWQVRCQEAEQILRRHGLMERLSPDYTSSQFHRDTHEELSNLKAAKVADDA